MEPIYSFCFPQDTIVFTEKQKILFAFDKNRHAWKFNALTIISEVGGIPEDESRKKGPRKKGLRKKGLKTSKNDDLPK